MAALGAGAGDAGAHDAALERAAPKPRALALETEPWPEPSPKVLPHVEILFPFAEQHIAPAHAKNYRVRLKVEHWPADAVELALDGQRARRLSTLEAPARLGSLVPADRELTAGEHLLVAIAVSPDGRTIKPRGTSSLQPYAAVRFWVGPRGKSHIDLEKPRLVYSEPRGTYNGAAAADKAFFDYYLLNAQLAAGKMSVTCRVTHAGASTRFAWDHWQALRLRGLESGDYTVELTLRGPDGKPLRGAGTSVRRTITVNRDAPTHMPAAFRLKK